ncbi:MAG: UDP-N-acetylglucosamine 2-epimerase (non-hydrolyzing) [Acidobacteria bacterium]|nr:MAG: UDP-N-acetylglucosamine 2-epimerase (non-hydrolyzing) [Acidobacteriota bacterium]PYR50729.1 MAG: UDP-N-acetylglucosamine 2-epimerase (non-hydrolyzing) [Acidobacteriota bacterium]
MKTIVHVVGARPNYMKIAPLMEALKPAPGIRQILVNTGQHYDEAMSKGFLRELSLPVPDRNLEVGSASQAVQTARVMIGFEDVCLADRPDLVVVVGDVNSTMAASLVAAKLLIPIAHVEAGLRSFDRTMPEEINRIVTDRLADLLLTPSADGNENLTSEGVPPEKIHLVGNIMIDTLLRHLPMATLARIQDRVPVRDRAYGVLTLHRPSNVDDPKTLRQILQAIATIARQLPVVFPVHPRTRERLNTFGVDELLANVIVTEPLGYIDFLSLTSHARVVLSDSGGLQEESTALGIPCLTLRENTERPVTVTHGTNCVVGTTTEAILTSFADAMAREHHPHRPPLWDGHTAGRIATVLTEFLAS